MYIGRANPDKGPKEAITIARRAGLPLRMLLKRGEPPEQRLLRARGRAAARFRRRAVRERDPRREDRAARPRVRNGVPDPLARAVRSRDGRSDGLRHPGHHHQLGRRARAGRGRRHRLPGATARTTSSTWCPGSARSTRWRAGSGSRTSSRARRWCAGTRQVFHRRACPLRSSAAPKDPGRQISTTAVVLLQCHPWPSRTPRRRTHPPSQIPRSRSSTSTSPSTIARSSAGSACQWSRVELHALMGPNGSGKSTLANTLLGNPAYTVTAGRSCSPATDITTLPIEERAALGPVPRLSASRGDPRRLGAQFLAPGDLPAQGHRRLLGARGPHAVIAWTKRLGMDSRFQERYLNEGFSGGEKKRNEMLQMALLEPVMAVLDETDSGLDIDALRQVAAGIDEIRKRAHRARRSCSSRTTSASSTTCAPMSCTSHRRPHRRDRRRRARQARVEAHGFDAFRSGSDREASAS